MTKIGENKKTGLEVWAHFDRSAQVYELFASDDASDYLGCCDTLDEARAFARWRFAEANG